MDAHFNTYKLNENNQEYILTTALLGNIISISCKSQQNESFSFSRNFTLEELKKVDQLFATIQTSSEALDFINNALNSKKVGIQEENDSLKLIFNVSTHGTEHQLEISLGEAISISSEQNNFEDKTEIIKGAELNLNQDFNMGQINTYNDSVPIIGPVEDENNYTSKLNNYDNITFGENKGFNITSELIDGGEGNIVNGTYENTYQESNNQYVEGIDSANIQFTNDNIATEATTDITSHFETGAAVDTTAQFTTDITTKDLTSQLLEGTGVDATAQFTADTTSATDLTSQFITENGVDSTAAQFTVDTITPKDLASQFVTSTGTEIQFGTEGNTDMTSQFAIETGIKSNQFGTEAITELESQLVEGNAVDANTNKFNTTNISSQFAEGTAIDTTGQFTTDATSPIDLTSQFMVSSDLDTKTAQFEIGATNSENITTDYQEYQSGTQDITSQYLKGLQETTNQYTENTDTDFTGQITTGENLNTENIGGEQYIDSNAQYSGEIQSTLNTYEQQNINLPIENISNQYLQSTQKTIQTTTTNTFTQPIQTFETPYISPADPIEDNFSSTTATQNINNQLYQTTQETINKTTTITLPLVREAPPIYDQQIQQPVSEPIIPDGRINELEGATSTLKSEHQLIQDKLNALAGQINSYKNQLSIIEKGKGDDEINRLRFENKAIKQQLSELNNLRNDAIEVKFLRSQLKELEILRRKVAEMEVLKSQLGELNALRARAGEFDAIKRQLEELNILKSQVAQMNILKQQLGELDSLRARVAELNRLKSHLGELNNLRAQVGQIDLLKRQIDELINLKIKSMDLGNLKAKVEELERIKLQYEQEIRNLREAKNRAQSLEQARYEELRKTSEIKMRNTGMDSRQLYFEESAQQICVKGEIIHNTDELELLTRKINKFNQRLTLNLLYKATADSDKASVFHEKCDDAKSTLVLVETDKGKRFGGFTTCSWAGECVDKKDEDAFVFSLDKMQIYENIPGEDAIGCYPKFGPIFLGCQIRIYDNAFTKGGTTFEKGLNFNTEEDFELTGGDRLFNVKDIEVYEVIPQ